MTTTTLAIDGIFVIFPVISITHNEKTHEKTEDRGTPVMHCTRYSNRPCASQGQ